MVRSSPSYFTAIVAVVALTALGAGIALYTALPEHQRVNRAAKADGAVVGSALVDALRGSLDPDGKATVKTVGAVVELATALASGVRAAK